MEIKEKEYKVSGKEITMSRLINAPVALVWEMFINPEHVKHWWGPTGFTNTIFKMDVKPGGEWEFMMHGPDGKDYFNKHTYAEVIMHKKLVFSHGSAPKFELSVVFEEQGNKTLLNIKSSFESAEMLQQVIKAVNAAEGLKQNIDKLEAYIPTLPAENELVILRQFNAPRELVFKAWTEPERLAKWWGPKGANISVSKLELKPGGTFLFSMKHPNGEDLWGKFVYREIASPEKLVFVNSFSDKEGGTTPNPWMPVWPLEILNTVILTEFEGKTTLIIKGKPINATAEEIKNFENFRDNLQGGFAGTFDHLDEYLLQVAQ